MSIDALLSRGDGSDTTVELLDGSPHRLADDELLWVDLTEPDDGELATVRGALRLTDSAAEALGAELGVPRATNLDEAVEVTLLEIGDDLDEEPVGLQILVGRGWLVTRHAKTLPRLVAHRDSIRDQREIGLLEPVPLLAAILDWHVDGMFAVAESLEREVDELDEAALRTNGDILERLVRQRRRIARVRRIAAIHHDVYREIARPDFLPEVEADDARLIARVTERLERGVAAIAHTRDMLIGTFDVHMTRTAQRTNDIVRVLTWASVILLPAVVIAGIMGMNFKVDIFENSALFWVVVGFMVTMAMTTLIVARWRGWL